MATVNKLLALKITEAQNKGIIPATSSTSPKPQTANNVAVIPSKPKARKTIHKGTYHAVSVAAFGYAGSKQSVIEAIKAAGGNQAETQRCFHIGYVAYRLNPTASAVTDEMIHVAAVALSSMNRKGERAGLKLTEKAANEAGVRKGKRVRSFNEQRAYDASRTAWSQILKLADIKTTASRGGARKPRPGSNRDDAEDKPNLADMSKASPGFETLGALHGFALMQAMMLLRTCNKNAKIASPQLTSAVSDFVAAVKACQPAD